MKKAAVWYARHGIKVECVQTDNGAEFSKHLSVKDRSHETLFETTTANLDIRHKLIRTYKLRHNGKV